MEQKPELICVSEFERRTSFALVSDGNYACMQFSNDDVLDAADGVWRVKEGAVSKHEFVRPTNADETVRVDGTTFAPALLERLRTLLASHKK